jgi:hypothetical protein
MTDDPVEGTMTYWLAWAAKETRVNSGRKPRHVSHRLDRDQGTIMRFEAHQNMPHDLDAVIAAYAEDCGTTPTEIWKRALDLWLDVGYESSLDTLIECKTTPTTKPE